MALVEAYSPCPCGSGQKFKWCCQKAEAQIEKLERLLQHGHLDTASKVLEEGLKVDPSNPMLLLRKATIAAQKGDVATGLAAANTLLTKHPRHPLGHALRVELTIGQDGAQVAAGALQDALTAVDPNDRPQLAPAASAVATALARGECYAGALAHAELARALDPEDNEIREVQSQLALDPRIPLLLKDGYRVAPVPEGLDAPRARRFQEALDWSKQGLWASAAASFDLLSAEGTPESDRNLGLCRLFLGDHTGAIEALRRYTHWIGPNPTTIDLEAICQLITPLTANDRVDLLQWVWPLRDRQHLAEWLASEPLIVSEGAQRLDPDDENSPQVESYRLLDRPIAATAAIQAIGDVPTLQGRLLVGQEIAVLEAFDDGRLDRLAEWFRDKAGASIPPAHPRTKRLGFAPRSLIQLEPSWQFPADMPFARKRALSFEGWRERLNNQWPDLKLPALGGSTARQGSKDPALELPIRAAIRTHELRLLKVGESVRCRLDDLRQKLGLDPDPQIDPTTARLESVPVTQVVFLPLSELSPDQLLIAYHGLRRYEQGPLLAEVAGELLKHPKFIDGHPGLHHILYSTLAVALMSTGETEQALSFVQKGREEQHAQAGQQEDLGWDVLEFRIRYTTQEPSEWVPFLVTIMARHRNNSEAMSAIMFYLTQLGLVQVIPNPDKPGEAYMDPRLLSALIERYGPKITTATGELGVSAARPAIWTPGSDTSQLGGKTTSSGLWTPGSDQPKTPGGGPESKIIVTG